MHTFEKEATDANYFSQTERVAFIDIEKECHALLSDPSIAALLEYNPTPLVVIGKHLQIIYANPAAQKFTNEAELELVQGLRLGEFFGINHKMRGHKCGDPGGCANCNELPIIEKALAGELSVHVGELLMNPDTDNERFYHMMGAPLPFKGDNLALVYLVKAE